jgi:hypothetical protein
MRNTANNNYFGCSSKAPKAKFGHSQSTGPGPDHDCEETKDDKAVDNYPHSETALRGKDGASVATPANSTRFIDVDSLFDSSNLENILTHFLVFDSR